MSMYRLFAALALPVVLITASCDDDDGTGPNVERFSAALSGANEVPPVTTQATGTTTLTVNGNFLGYRIEVANIVGVTAAHIHRGTPGVNGPIMTPLFSATPPTGPMTGLLIHSAVSVPDSVVAHLRNGTAYVNVHTQSNPGGLIRGQVARQ